MVWLVIARMILGSWFRAELNSCFQFRAADFHENDHFAKRFADHQTPERSLRGCSTCCAVSRVSLGVLNFLCGARSSTGATRRWIDPQAAVSYDSRSADLAIWFDILPWFWCNCAFSRSHPSRAVTLALPAMTLQILVLQREAPVLLQSARNLWSDIHQWGKTCRISRARLWSRID